MTTTVFLSAACIALGAVTDLPPPLPADAAPASQWLFKAGAVIVLAATAAGMVAGRRGWRLPSRQFPAIAAIEEAVGRCAETGRPLLFTSGGAGEIRRVELFASMPVLRLAAALAARYGVRLIVPVCYNETIAVHALAVRDARLAEGAFDSVEEAEVRYLPGGQFLFAVASMGWMARERPGGCLYFGSWEADSLMFASEGRSLDALQIAATPELIQIPFFLACCDHVLIGEEFWAATTCIGGQPSVAGAQSAQDLLKLAALVAIAVGVAAATLDLGPLSAWVLKLRSALV